MRENLELGSFLKRDRQGIEARLERVLELFPRLGERLGQAGRHAVRRRAADARHRARADGRPAPACCSTSRASGSPPSWCAQIFDAIIEIAKGGLTILLVEQNTRLALETAHQAHVLVTGEIALSGSSQALREDPRVRAAYLGEDVSVE